MVHIYLILPEVGPIPSQESEVWDGAKDLLSPPDTVFLVQLTLQKNHSRPREMTDNFTPESRSKTQVSESVLLHPSEGLCIRFWPASWHKCTNLTFLM